MKNGTISQVFLDEEAGYYVFVKMIDNNSTASYQKACDSAVTSAQTEKYDKWYEELKGTYKINVNASVWNDVTIGTMTTEIVTADDLQKMSKKSSSSKSSSSSSEKSSSSSESSSSSSSSSSSNSSK